MKISKKPPKRDNIGLTAKRAMGILCFFGAVMLFLIGKIFYMQYFQYDKYQQKVLDQITYTSTLTAMRGNIYDSNMNPLATNKTVWRIFISP
ncbi:MAG: hypothetical protein IIW20_05230, partial [Clostridia bacterium]|nr:hypothetical protein [Clostridia bacterium]